MTHLVSRSQADTKALAVHCADSFFEMLQNASCIVALLGPLGAGKTFFSKCVIEHLSGITDAPSPTYTLCHQYPLKQNTSAHIEHWDLYRLSAVPEELLEAPAKGMLRLIEWADKFPEVLALCDMQFQFELLNEQERGICYGDSSSS